MGLGRSPAHAAQAPNQLRVVTKDFPPFVIIEDGRAQGFSIDLLDKIAARVGFTYQLEIVDSVGEQIQAVSERTADLAIAGISITSSREESVDFSYPMFRSGLQILTRVEQGEVSPFSASLTGTVLPLVAKLLVLLLLVAHVVWLVRRRRDADFPQTYFRGIGEGLWFAAESMATVSYGEDSPRRVWGRLAATAWMFLAIFVVANLTGSISADLVGQQLEGAINGPSDLPGQKIATVGSTTSAEFLEARNLDVRETRTIDEAFDLLIGDEVDAVVMDSPVLRYFASEEGKGQVQVVGPLFGPQDYGIALPKDGPLRKAINRAILELVEDGTYARLERSWFGEQE